MYLNDSYSSHFQATSYSVPYSQLSQIILKSKYFCLFQSHKKTTAALVHQVLAIVVTLVDTLKLVHMISHIQSDFGSQQ